MPAGDLVPAAVETFGHPGAARILADRGITVARGDGGITLTECAYGNYQIKLGAVTSDPSDGDTVCFSAPRADGYLALTVPGAYRINTYGRSVRASLSTNDRPVESIDVAANATKGIGESLDPNNTSVILELSITGTSVAPPAPQPTDPALAFAAKLNVGPGNRACTSTLVDRYWVLTAASCFADDPSSLQEGAAPEWTTVTIGRTDLTNTAVGAVIDVDRIVPRADHSLVMARLASPIDNIAPAVLATTPPVIGESVRIPGYGRTATTWVPSTLHTTAHTVTAVAGADLGTAPAIGAVPLCNGDAGAPVLGIRNGSPQLLGIASRSWQGGCLGESETRNDAVSSRTDDVAGWVQQVRSTTPGWKTQALVRSGTGLSQTARLAGGSWTPLQDIQVASIGGVKAVSTTGIDSDTHIVVLGGDGHLHHTVRHLTGSWDHFGDLNSGVTDLGGITQVSVSSIGADLHVVVLADGQLFHSIRDADGRWTPFGPVFSATGPLTGITAVAAASSGPDLQLAVIANGVYHTARYADGNWGTWGSVDAVAGNVGTVTSLAMSRQGSDMNLVVVTNTGALFHTVRHQDASWQPFSPLTGVFGQTTATSVSSAPVDGDTQIAVTTTDNRVLLVSRHADTTWSTPQPVDLPGLTGNHIGTAVAGTL
ncbi:trypsin-like serine protease [Kitasatospora purpeofusca]|uniref:trypsin-like serine protease n=1 Tax=Kitasatospora purpeofusca TaxID=67352 RepID=UPI00381DAE67